MQAAPTKKTPSTTEPLRRCNQAITACRRSQDWQKALCLLSSTTRQVLRPSVITYGAVVARVSWPLAGHLLRDLQTFDDANLILYSTNINACGKAALWQRATCFLGELDQKSLEPNVVTTSAAISAFEKAALELEDASKAWQWALQLSSETEVDLVSCNAAMSAATKTRRWRVAVAILQDLQKSHLEPSEVTCSASLGACTWPEAVNLLTHFAINHLKINAIGYSTALSSCEDWRWGTQLFQEIQLRRQLPTLISYNALISAVGVQLALDLLEELQGIMLEPDIVTFNAAISACEKSNQWKEALALVSEAQRQGISCDVITFNAAISACGRCQKLQEAINFLGAMEQQTIQPTVVSFNSVISAASWPVAMMLLAVMEEKTVQADLITYNTAIGACEKDSCWQGALHLLRQLRQLANVSADLISYNTALAADKKNWTVALALLSEVHFLRLELDPITSNTAIRACQAFRRWVEAIALLEAARAWNAVNVVTFSEVISNCEQGGAHQQTLVLLNQMERLTALKAKKRSNLQACGG